MLKKTEHKSRDKTLKTFLQEIYLITLVSLRRNVMKV